MRYCTEVLFVNYDERFQCMPIIEAIAKKPAINPNIEPKTKENPKLIDA